ncbi:MAG: hypothetical protein ABIJ48_06375 [Actinomycetota bacterium]
MRITQSGPEFCRLSAQEGFVLINVPVTIVVEAGDSTNLMLISRMGSFEGRPEHMSVQGIDAAPLPFRLPSKVFREGEHVTLLVFQMQQPAGPALLWTRHYEARWIDWLPQLGPVLDGQE